MRKSIKVIVTLLFLGNLNGTFAQSWSPVGTGTDSAVFALAINNGSLYAGGQFTFAGGIVTPSIASWNGSSWSDVGGGILNFNGNNVQALCSFNNEVYAGGFYGGNSTDISKWNGSAWGALGTGITGGVVKVLAAYNGNVYAGGVFQAAGGSSIKHIAKWDGVNWSQLGNGLNYGPTSISNTGGVYAMAVYNGELFIGGDFVLTGNVTTSFIAKWNGTSWSQVGSGLDNAVWSLSVYNGELYAVGWFLQAGGLAASHIAKWNGSVWSAVGTGISNSGTPLCMAVYNNELYVGGTIVSAGGVAVSNIARWNGSTWSAVGTGTNAQINTLTTYNGDLYAGGFFTIAGGLNAKYIAKWNYPACIATVNPNGNQNFCTGPGITLQANTGAGLAYQWRKNGVNIAGAANSSYLANSTGTFNVIVTNGLGCSATSTGVSVTSPPSNTVSAGGPTHFCTGGNVTLTTTSGQPVTYKWRKNGAYITGATNSTYVATSTGSYNCVVTNSFGCSKGGIPIAVTGPPSAVITANGPTTFCAGGSVQLSAQGGYTYQWIKNSTNISGATLQNYTTTTAGNYKVKVTDPFGCSKTTPNTNQITVSVPCREANANFTDVDNIATKVNIFPNPACDDFTLSIKESENENIFISIYDVTGRIVFTKEKNFSSDNLKFGKDFLPGIYFVEVDRNNKTEKLKIVKVK